MAMSAWSYSALRCPITNIPCALQPSILLRRLHAEAGKPNPNLPHQHFRRCSLPRMAAALSSGIKAITVLTGVGGIGLYLYSMRTFTDNMFAIVASFLV